MYQLSTFQMLVGNYNTCLQIIYNKAVSSNLFVLQNPASSSAVVTFRYTYILHSMQQTCVNFTLYQYRIHMHCYRIKLTILLLYNQESQHFEIKCALFIQNIQIHNIYEQINTLDVMYIRALKIYEHLSKVRGWTAHKW